MTYEMNTRCDCANCPDAGCSCGYQAGDSVAYVMALPPRCNCGPACGCEAAEQGCVCG